ncbi:MAG TPA: nicotinamidase, partial [Methylomirabilota bacterium]|nr:nicotinamidase [Methylomirabilota bacterium]
MSTCFRRILVGALLLFVLSPCTLRSEWRTLPTRQRIRSGADTNAWVAVEKTVRLDLSRTAVVICDMWDRHWCASATRRVAEMAPRMNAFAAAARAGGALVIHCPSDTMEFYEGTPQRRLAQSAPVVEPRVPLQRWCSLDRTKEAPLPIDDSDGGCDDDSPPPKGPPYPWTRQIATLEIKEGDAVTDSAEAYYLMRQRGLTNVIVMGVHLNMCVLGRPFSIRQMVNQGQNVLLVRDLTDTMYNPRQRPFVPHCVGTELMIEHVEKFWCPTITSAALLGGQPFRFSEDRRPHAVCLIGEDEYKTWETLPAFARTELEWRGLRVSIIKESPADKHQFPGLIEALRDADLLVVSVRRRALPREQLDAIRAHLDAGKPLVGLRTASHAFAPRGRDAERAGAGTWTSFDADVLGGNYSGHHGAGPTTTVTLVADAKSHPVLTGVAAEDFRSRGSLYKVSPLKADATVLLMGSIAGQPA